MIRSKNTSYIFQKNILLKLTFFLIIGSYYLFVFIQQILFMLNNRLLHEEHRQLFPYYQINEPELFKGDYITSFLTSGNQPILYDLLTRGWLSLGGGLLEFHRVMPITLWVLLLASAALAGWKLKGVVGSIGAFALVLTQPLFLYQITSAIPHAFAFPLLGWTIVALLYGNVSGMVGLTLLSCVLYFPVTPIIGLSLAGWLVLYHQEELKKFNISTITRIIAIVGITGCLSIFLGFSVLQPKEGFGESLVPYQEVEKYPENGIEGRAFIGVKEPLFYVTAKFVNQFREWIGIKWGSVLLLVYLFLALRGFFTLTRNSLVRKGIGVYIVVSTFVALLFFVLKPHLAYRFLLYPFLIVFSILVPVWLAKILSGITNKRLSLYLPIVFIFLFTLTLDGNSQTKIGYYSVIDDEKNEVLNFVQTLPAESLIAGWPNNSVKGNITEIIPYIAKRRIFILGKAHYPNYKGYLMDMRDRMYALIDAYSATDEVPIKNLKDSFGVDFLLVDKRDFTKENSDPEYFAPFNEYIHSTWEVRKMEGFVLAEATLRGKVFETENYYILNINEFLAEVKSAEDSRD